MRKLLFAICATLLFSSPCIAQTKFETKWHCQKPSAEHHFDVGDQPDHTYGIAQGPCSATSGGKDFGEKTGQFTEFDEEWKASMTGHRFLVTTESGDKVFYIYETSGATDPAKPASNKWKISGGTGKFKDAKGSGTCTGKRNTDGSSDWQCTGTHTGGK